MSKPVSGPFHKPEDRFRIADLISAGKLKADLVVKNGKLVNVLSSEIYDAEVALVGKRIAMVCDSVKEFESPNTVKVDARGAFLVPGLIDVHYHVAGTYLTMTNLSASLLARGTTAIATDFYEYGAVAGINGVRLGLEEGSRTPLKILFNVPLLAYIQNDPFGNTGKTSAADLAEMLDWDAAVALGEVQPQTASDSNVRALIRKAVQLRKTVVGHHVGFDEKGLAAWLVLGATSDHESVGKEEAFEKVRRGVRIVAREGSAATDLGNVLQVVSEGSLGSRRFMLCTDEVDARELATLGHMDFKVRKAIGMGIAPLSVLEMATINAAEYYRVDDDIGSITAGRFGDLLVVDDLRDFRPRTVIANGKVVAEKGVFKGALPPGRYPQWMRRTIHLPRRLNEADFNVKARRKDSRRAEVNVLIAQEGLLISGKKTSALSVQNGVVLPDPAKDVLKISVVERHGANLIGNGFVSGFRLTKGAVAESFAPVPENLVVVGASDKEAAIAINRVRELQGGFVVCAGEDVVAELRLPVLGLMSAEPLEKVAATLDEVTQAVGKLGCGFKSPFLTLMFMAYPLIPTLKITESGLVDVDRMKKISVVIGES